MDYLFPVHENRHEPVAAICYKLQAADVIQPDFAIPNHGSSQNNNDWLYLKAMVPYAHGRMKGDRELHFLSDYKN